MTLHLKALAVFRIVLAAVVLADLGQRFPLVELLLSDRGYLPRSHLGLAEPSFWPSLYLLSGSPGWALALSCLQAIAALALLLGIGTRWAGPATWFLTLSLQQRNPFILTTGDALLQTLLFWGMLLPWGRFWSVDARRAKWKGAPTVRSWATTGLGLQMVMVYAFSAVHQQLDPFWRNGDALWLIFQGRLWSRSGGWAPAPHQGLEWLVLLTEALLALGLLLPFVRVRRAAIVLGLVFHLTTFAWLAQGLFPLVAIAGLLALWPGSGPAPAPLGRPRGVVDGLSVVALSLAFLANLASLTRWQPYPMLYRVASMVSANQSWREFTGPGLTQERGTRVEILGSDGSISTTFQIRGPRGWRDDLYLQRLQEPPHSLLLEPFVAQATRQWELENPGLKVARVSVVAQIRQVELGQAPAQDLLQTLWPRPAENGR